MTISPSSTPMVDSTTADSTRKTEVSLLNCARRIAKIRKIAVPKAFIRKAPAFSRSSSSPFCFQVTPGPRAAVLGEADEDVSRSVSVGRPVVRDLPAVGDKLPRRAGRADAGAVFRRLRL